jgi:hypothetical protein
MRGKLITAAILALELSINPLAAQDQGTTPYPATFFADARPTNASDMIDRLPGFQLDTGASARGFAGTAGNVLIDGARPTAKTDDLGSILGRITADSVERIDVIRGSAPGIDMQGQSVVANIIRRKDAGDQLVAIVNNTYVENGEWEPGAKLEYHGSVGAIRYEGAIGRTVSNNDDSAIGGWARPARCRRSMRCTAAACCSWDTPPMAASPRPCWAGPRTTISPCRARIIPAAFPIPAAAARASIPYPAPTRANSAVIGRAIWGR